MRIEFRILGGARAGQSDTFDKSVVLIGRHPLSDLRFDAELDRDVSTRHAEVRVVGDRVTLIDNQSTNGTFVNGTRVAGEWSLKTGDVVAFGKHGPTAEVRVTAPATTGAGAARAPQPPAPPRTSVSPSDAPRTSQQGPPGGELRRSTTERVAVAVRQQTSNMRLVMFGLAGIVLIGTGAAVWFGKNLQRTGREDLERILASYDSVSGELARVRTQVGQVAGLSEALARSDSQVRRLRAQMSSGSGAPGDVAAFQQQLSAIQQLQQIGSDASSVFNANAPAVVVVRSELPSGGIQGTGFAVTGDGYVVTNRHMVREGGVGASATSIGVKFTGQMPFLEVVVAAIDSQFDLALLKLADPADLTLLKDGRAPAIAGIRSGAPPSVGSSIFVFGFPLTQSMGLGRGEVPRPTFSAGHVSNMAPDTLQIDAFAAPGTSGAPVFDQAGLLVGVVFGGLAGSSNNIVYAVPGRVVLALLGSRGTALAR